jgi:predicted dithiol-disulfide oxidoreductase (DUF899 family)
MGNRVPESNRLDRCAAGIQLGQNRESDIQGAASMSTADSTSSQPSIRFPGESSDYRTARDRLLAEEIDLRRRTEEVAAMRRQLPPGGPLAQDYEFYEDRIVDGRPQDTRKVRFSELFRRADASLAVYSFMYGPKMAHACPMCTAMLDSLDGCAPHATQCINLVVVASSPIERIRAHALERGWKNLRLLSSAGNSYNRDYHGEDGEGDQLPMLNVFAYRGGRIRHCYGTELLFAPEEPGQNARHVDPIWPLWSLFDFTPEGRGANWYPKLTYPG